MSCITSSTQNSSITDSNYTNLFTANNIRLRSGSPPPSNTAYKNYINSMTALQYYVYGYYFAKHTTVTSSVSIQNTLITDSNYTNLFTANNIRLRSGSPPPSDTAYKNYINSMTALQYYIYGYNYGCSSPSPSTVPSVNCVVSAWSDGTTCDTSGYLKQTRTITTQPSGNGQACPSLTQVGSTPCGTNCVVSAWSDGTTCDTSGYLNQTRTITTQPSGNGQACPSLTQVGRTPCGTNCVVSAWSDDTTCDTSGYLNQTRTITTQPSGNGQACPSLTQVGRTPCNAPAAASNPTLEVCQNAGDDVCGQGQEYYNTNCVNPYGINQVGEYYNTCEGGGTSSVPSVNCVVSAWSDGTTCDTSGYLKQTRTITTQPSGNGQACPSLNQVGSTPCGFPVPSLVNDTYREMFSGDSTLVVDNSGTMIYNWFLSQGQGSNSALFVIRPSASGGFYYTYKSGNSFSPTLGPSGTATFSSTNISINGMNFKRLVGTTWSSVTNIDCVVSAWSDDTTCDTSGYLKQTRTITTQPSGNGQACPSLTQVGRTPCNTAPAASNPTLGTCQNRGDGVCDQGQEYYNTNCVNPYGVSQVDDYYTACEGNG
jgi:hypothetical protein